MAKKLTSEGDAALRAMGVLDAEMHDDLDIDRGGTSWLHGQLDWKRNCICTDYALASSSGVGLAITAAEAALRDFSNFTFSRDHEFRSRMNAASKAGQTDLWNVAYGDEQSRERDEKVRFASEHVFTHLVQALDRVAAVTIFVLGLERPLLKAGWPDVGSYLDGTKEPRDRKGLAKQTEEGLALQAKVLARWSEKIGNGPKDWLPWLIQTRNLIVHRSEMATMHFQSGAGPGSRLVVPFPLHPDWAIVELMVGESRQFEDFYLMRDPEATLRGLTAETLQLVASIAADLVHVWRRRRESPAILIQPGRQWPKLQAGRRLEFEGFGDPIRLPSSSQIRVGTQLTKRWQAARLLEKDKRLWSED